MTLRSDVVRATVISIWLLSSGVAAQPSQTAEELIRQEEVREAVEDALDLYFSPVDDGGTRNDNLVRSIDRLVEIGPEVIPYLVSELEQAQPRTFFFSAYGLGRIGTEASGEALRAAIATADGQPGDWAGLRKAWACWALGLMGETDAIDLILSGRHATGNAPIHAQFTVLESIAMQTAPDSQAVLEKHWNGMNSENDPRYAERTVIVKAMGHVLTPEARAWLIRVLQEEHPLLARQAAFGLGEHDSPEAVAALVSALEAPDVRVRRAVAIALYDALPVSLLELPVSRLEEEENSVARGALYKAIARAGGPDYTDVLIAQWGKPDPLDRMQLVQVLPQLDSDKTLPLLREALQDPSAQVAIAAAVGLAELGSAEAIRTLIDTVATPTWSVASVCLDQLVRIHESGAVPAIETRLIEVELAGVVTDPRRRMRAERLVDALVSLGRTTRMGELREAASRQKDGQLVETLDRQIRRLQTLRDNGTKTKRWLEALDSSETDVRMLAYDYFGRNGTARTASALVDRFGRVDPSEGLAILRAVGSVGGEATTELLTRVLTAPEFDPFERAPLRDMAAWSARRIGGPAMRDLLEAAVVRRDGRDTRPLVYYSLVAGADAVPALTLYRAQRMRYITSFRGAEMKKLDWIRRELTHDRPLDPVDLPPEDLNF